MAWNWLRKLAVNPTAKMALGERGEKFAARYLRRHGYRILVRRFKTRAGKASAQSARGEAEIAAPPVPVEFSVVRQAVLPMSADEAVREMEDQGQDFRLFLDRDSQQVRVVYRRSDESYAILQPVKKVAR